jgi:hypothetical protein
MVTLARTSVLPKTIFVGALSAQLPRPFSRPVMAALRRLQRPVSANSGHSPTASRTGQVDPLQLFRLTSSKAACGPGAEILPTDELSAPGDVLVRVATAPIDTNGGYSDRGVSRTLGTPFTVALTWKQCGFRILLSISGAWCEPFGLPLARLHHPGRLIALHATIKIAQFPFQNFAYWTAR